MKQSLGKSYFFKLNMLIVFSVMFLSFPAIAMDKEDFGNLLIKCFFWYGDYESLELPSIPESKSSTPTKTAGTLRFRGGISHSAYSMDFTIYTRLKNGKQQLKIEPTDYNTMINMACPLTDWN